MKNQAFNPFLPSYEYIPDGEPYIFNNRVHVYGSHDRFDGTGFCMNDYVCWSAPVDDLSNWRYDGVIYRKGQDPQDPDGTRSMYAPDIMQGADGRYYLFYALDMGGVMSVAVCDEPTGDFQFYGHVRRGDGSIIGTSPDDIFQFDPGVFMDDDGRVFLYSGFSPRNHEKFIERKLRVDGCYVMELEPDMLTVKYEPKLVLTGAGAKCEHFPGYAGHEYFEAPSIRKINRRYYLAYSSINFHELCYAVSDKPDEGFEYGGTIVSIGDVFLNGRTGKNALNYLGNTHGGMINIHGQWYIFYHRHTNFHDFSRQMCAEPICFGEDGRIQQVEVTSCGLNGGALSGIGEYEARIACNLTYRGGSSTHRPNKSAAGDNPYFTQNRADAEPGEYAESYQYIANMRDGAMAGFKYFQYEGAGTINVRVRGNAYGKMVVSTAPDGVPLAEIRIKPSENFEPFYASLCPWQGVSGLYFIFAGEGWLDFLSFKLDVQRSGEHCLPHNT